MPLGPLPLISVLLPAHNAERWIAAAVSSILSQTFEDFELILVDDHSSDGTAPYLERIARTDPRVRLVANQGRGLLPALLTAVSVARGTFLARMDADDVADPRRFASQVNHLQQHPRCVALGTGILCIDEEGLPLFSPPVSPDHESIVDQLLHNRPGKICHPTAMMRKAAYVQAGGYRQDYHYEDVDLFLRLAECGRLANLPEPLLSYRLVPSSISRTRDPARAAQIYRRIAERAAVGLGLPPPGPECFAVKGAAESAYQLHRSWSASAADSGYRKSARKHAWRAWRSQPFSGQSWWTLTNALLGRRAADRMTRFKRTIATSFTSTHESR